MKSKRTWREKLADSKDLPKVIPYRGNLLGRNGKGTLVIPAPMQVDALMRKVRKGRLTTIDQMRDCLATQHGTTMCCPITTGIFAWIAAHAADEAERAGIKRITPYWRTLKARGELNPKYPGGIDALVSRLRDEGHSIVQKGKRFFVADFAKSLARLTP